MSSLIQCLTFFENYHSQEPGSEQKPLASQQKGSQHLGMTHAFCLRKSCSPYIDWCLVTVLTRRDLVGSEATWDKQQKWEQVVCERPVLNHQANEIRKICSKIINKTDLIIESTVE